MSIVFCKFTKIEWVFAAFLISISAGELRNIDTNERFEFRIDQDDQLYNQKRYEAIGEVSVLENYLHSIWQILILILLLVCSLCRCTEIKKIVIKDSKK